MLWAGLLGCARQRHSLDDVQGAELPEPAVAPACILEVNLQVSQHQVVPGLRQLALTLRVHNPATDRAGVERDSH